MNKRMIDLSAEQREKIFRRAVTLAAQHPAAAGFMILSAEDDGCVYRYHPDGSKEKIREARPRA